MAPGGWPITGAAPSSSAPGSSPASPAPAEHVARHRRALHQAVRELRASARRRTEAEHRVTATRAVVLARKAAAAAGPDAAARQRRLAGLSAALAGHDPTRTLARGYALVERPGGELVASAATARAAGSVRIRFADGTVAATIEGGP